MIDQDLDAYLARHIPLTRSMGVKLGGWDNRGLSLVAPLAPNLNDKGTAFAGALATLVTLSGWALTHLTLREHGERADVVIARSRIEYLRPVEEEIVAVCRMPEEGAVGDLLGHYSTRGRARWELWATVGAGGKPAVEFRGLYVAQRPPTARGTPGADG